MATVLAGCTDPQAPVLGAITVEPSFATTESAMIFSIRVANEAEDGPFSYAWDFGDGGTSSSKEPSHRFADAGEYGVSVTVDNAAGSDTETERVLITEPDADLYFWTQNAGNGRIQVTINGISKFVVAYHTQFPGCALGSGLAEFVDLPYGTYTYSAVAEFGMTWSGTITLDDNCANVPLN